MALTPEEREELKEELRREQAEAAKTPEQRAEEAETEKYLDSLAERIAKKLKGDGAGGPPPPEKKPRTDHPIDRKLFGRR